MFETPTASSAIFEVLEGGPWPLRIHVSGEGYAFRSATLHAAVGDVPVEQIRTWGNEGGFTGVLAEMPADGAVLRVGWADDVELAETPVVFHTGDNV
jgi:hypothetical protein